MSDEWIIGSETKSRIMRAVAAIEGIRGPRVSRGSGGEIFIGDTPSSQSSPLSVRMASLSSTVHLAIVTSSTRDGSNWRWTYTMQWAANSGTGFGTWAGSGDTFSAYNLSEVGNNTTTASGIAVPTGMTVQPMPTGMVRSLFMHAGKYWFEWENAITGGCT